MCRASIPIILIYPRSFAAHMPKIHQIVWNDGEWCAMTVKLKEGVPKRMRWQAGMSFVEGFFQNQGNLTGKFHKDWTKIQTMIHTNLMRICGAGGVRRRHTGEGNEWKNSRNPAGLTKVMQRRCRGRTAWDGAVEVNWAKRQHKTQKKTILVDCHQTIFAVIAKKRTVTHSSLGPWCFAIP